MALLRLPYVINGKDSFPPETISHCDEVASYLRKLWENPRPKNEPYIQFVMGGQQFTMQASYDKGKIQPGSFCLFNKDMSVFFSGDRNESPRLTYEWLKFCSLFDYQQPKLGY